MRAQMPVWHSAEDLDAVCSEIVQLAMHGLDRVLHRPRRSTIGKFVEREHERLGLTRGIECEAADERMVVDQVLAGLALLGGVHLGVHVGRRRGALARHTRHHHQLAGVIPVCSAPGFLRRVLHVCVCLPFLPPISNQNQRGPPEWVRVRGPQRC